MRWAIWAVMVAGEVAAKACSGQEQSDLTAALRRTTSSEPGSRPSPSGSCADAS